MVLCKMWRMDSLDTADNERAYCKCVMYDFDKNEDCPYFVDRRIDNEI